MSRQWVRVVKMTTVPTRMPRHRLSEAQCISPRVFW
ncbi:hypothetical protein ABH941_003840 [Streptacidiphilus sp. EB103A]